MRTADRVLVDIDLFEIRPGTRDQLHFLLKILEIVEVTVARDSITENGDLTNRTLIMVIRDNGASPDGVQVGGSKKNQKHRCGDKQQDLRLQIKPEMQTLVPPTDDVFQRLNQSCCPHTENHTHTDQIIDTASSVLALRRHLISIDQASGAFRYDLPCELLDADCRGSVAFMPRRGKMPHRKT